MSTDSEPARAEGAWVTVALEAVIAYHKQQRDTYWNCPSSGEMAAGIAAAAPLIRAPERARAEAAEAKVAEMRQAVITFRNRYAGTLDDQASDVICGVLQVADRTPLRAQGRSDEKEATL